MLDWFPVYFHFILSVHTFLNERVHISFSWDVGFNLSFVLWLSYYILYIVLHREFQGKAVRRFTICPTGREGEGRMESRKWNKREGEGSELIGSHVLSPGLSM